jgi:Fur family ferric uptake transcriptional regulator
MQDAKLKFEQFVQYKGLRHTDQRRCILDVFLSTERHVTVQELYDLVRKRNKQIGYATVARAVKLIEEAGLGRIVDFGDGVQRFEHEYGHDHHDHLICVKCGKFVEIYSEKIEKLQNQLVKKHKFTHQYHKLEIFGLCPRCKGKSSGRSGKKN